MRCTLVILNAKHRSAAARLHLLRVTIQTDEAPPRIWIVKESAARIRSTGIALRVYDACMYGGNYMGPRRPGGILRNIKMVSGPCDKRQQPPGQPGTHLQDEAQVH